MKKLNSFFLMGSVALAGLGVMSSCSSDDLSTDSTNITDNKAVKTQFALNIPRANGGTRMSADNTQGESSSTFLGMEDIKLYSFSEEPGAGKTSTSSIELTKLGISDISSTTSSKIYTDVEIPVGTTNFLFYGHAPIGTTTADEKFEKGLLGFTPDKMVNNIKLELIPAKGPDGGKEAALLSILNGVAEVSGWSAQTATTELGKLYKKYLETKAGSANSIRLTLQRLYNNLGGVTTSGTDAEKGIAKAIRTKIKESFTQTIDPTDNSAVLTYKTENTYPNNMNLPDGAVQVVYDNTAKKFKYVTSTSLTGLGTLDASKICFPSSIYYFCSSNLAATASEEINWPNTTTGWIGSGTGNAPWLKSATALANGWTEDVKATTRSIAMRQNINYGVASLKTTVKCNAATLADNTSLTVVDPNEFTGNVSVPNEGFHVTGLLIGGQPVEVKYDFQPASSDVFDRTVYDRNLDNIFAQNGTASSENYTIVLPNDLGRTETSQKIVNVAIELENTSGADFRGADGIVPNGGKFYLVGHLRPSGKTVTVGGTDISNPAVFMSDYQTTLKLTIKSLENAYNTIPDLRSTKLQFGLSVDLEWKQGIQFNVTLD